MIRFVDTTLIRLPALAIAAIALALGGCSEQAATAEVSQAGLLELLESTTPPLVLDVRTPEEYASGRVPGAVNIPHTELPARLGELGGDEREIVVYCERGGRASTAIETLREAGFTMVSHLDGDMSAWRDAELPCDGC